MDARAELLVSRGRALLAAPAEPVRFKGQPEAAQLVNDLQGHPHAFVIACILDRQIRFDLAWRAPYELSKRLGGFDFQRLRSLSALDWQSAMTQPSSLHRYSEIMSANVHSAVELIALAYCGDAARIWNDRPTSADLVFRFLAFRGVGPKIATMAANILVRNFKIALSDHFSIDISADVHVRRVFARLGLTEADPSVSRVVYKARALCPDFPGIMDLPAWEIGNSWCRPVQPRCNQCYMIKVCNHALGSGAA
jgi:endonuclease-3